MTKSNFMRIVLIVSSVLIIVGISLMGWMLATSEERNVIKIRLKDGKTETIEFKGLGLIPGESCEYTIELKGDQSLKYDLSFDFAEAESEDEMTLKLYAYVRISSGDEVLYDDLLVNAYENDSIAFPVDFREDLNTELTVTFYLPIEVGNEAKNAEAIFDLLLTASNEE